MGSLSAQIRKSRQRGFSLIELIAASLVLGVAITGVMSILGTGRTLEFQNKLRREARLIAADALEDSTLHYSQYSTLIAGTLPVRTVLLDSGTVHPVSADITIRILPEVMETWMEVSGLPNPQVPSKTIKVNVGWNADGQADSVMITKRIAEVR